jgi:Domain of unknown function (DUF1772)
MLPTLQLFATLTAILFAGAALYIHIAEHPARMALDTKTAALQWAKSYQRATWLQAPLAAFSFISGTAAWLLGGHVAWLMGASVIGLAVPFTLLCVMPTNHQLLDPGRALESGETRSLLEKWNRLHAVRTLLSVAASFTFLWLLYASMK